MLITRPFLSNRLLRSLPALLLGTLLGLPVQRAQAQEGPFRILIPDFLPVEGADDDFGKDAAEALRGFIGTMATHEPVERESLLDELDRLDVKMKGMDCVRTRQVGRSMDIEMVLCASYTEREDSVHVELAFWDLGSAQSFTLPDLTAHRDRADEAARRIYESFDRFIEQASGTRYCQQYAQLGEWERALTNCDRALEINPEAHTTRYHRARVLMELDRLEESYAELKAVLEERPVDEKARRLAGYVATRLGEEDEGREHYRAFLELQPGAVSVRRKVAFDLYDAGDPRGAMLLIQEGLSMEEDPRLLLDLGNYAFAAAAEVAGTEQTEGRTSEVAGLYRIAVDAYLSARDSLDAEMGMSQLRNTVSALLKLGETRRAVEVAREVVEAREAGAAFWSVYAEALHRDGAMEEAIAALAHVETLDPAYRRLYLRWGSWLLEAGRQDEALGRLRLAVERGEEPDVAARVLFADAYGQGVKPEDWPYAIRGLEAAKSFEPGGRTAAMIDFWLGYSLYQRGVEIQEPETKETAEETLPIFRRALELFQAGRPYAENDSSIELQKFLDAATRYIEIQEAIIKRGA